MKYFYFEEKLFQIGAALIISNWSRSYFKSGRICYFKTGQTYYKLGQLFQIGAIISNRCRTTITNAFLQILDNYGRKLNKMWEDKGSKFYNISMKSWLQDNVKEMYSTHNEEKSVVVERFIRTLQNKIYKMCLLIMA